MHDTSTRVALVTGAGRGIGAAIARHLARAGTLVAVNDMDAVAADDTVAAITAAGGHAQAFVANITQRAAVQAMVEGVAEQFGRLDILVNNAGILRDNLLFRMSEDDWDAVMNVHLKGAFNCTQAAQAMMVRQKWGRIISLSSISALGNRGQANYATAKAGLQGFTRTLAIELGPFGITANAVAPGYIETEMTHAMAARMGRPFAELAAELSQTVPVRRLGQPDDVAALVAFLCSEAAGYVSGQVIYVAGGPE